MLLITTNESSVYHCPNGIYITVSSPFHTNRRPPTPPPLPLSSTVTTGAIPMSYGQPYGQPPPVFSTVVVPKQFDMTLNVRQIVTNKVSSSQETSPTMTMDDHTPDNTLWYHAIPCDAMPSHQTNPSLINHVLFLTTFLPSSSHFTTRITEHCFSVSTRYGPRPCNHRHR